MNHTSLLKKRKRVLTAIAADTLAASFGEAEDPPSAILVEDQQLTWEKANTGCFAGKWVEEVQRLLSFLTRVEVLKSDGQTQNVENVFQDATQVYERLAEDFIGAQGYFEHPQFPLFVKNYLKVEVSNTVDGNLAIGGLLDSTTLTGTRPRTKKTGKRITDSGSETLADLINVYLPAWKAQLNDDGTIPTADTWESVLEKTKISVYQSGKLSARRLEEESIDDNDDAGDSRKLSDQLPSDWTSLLLRNWLSFVYCGPYGAIKYNFEPLIMLQTGSTDHGGIANDRSECLNKNMTSQQAFREAVHGLIEVDKRRIVKDIMLFKVETLTAEVANLSSQMAAFSNLAASPLIPGNQRQKFLGMVLSLYEQTMGTQDNQKIAKSDLEEYMLQGSEAVSATGSRSSKTSLPERNSLFPSRFAASSLGATALLQRNDTTRLHTSISSSINVTAPGSISTEGQALIIVATEGSSVSIGPVSNMVVGTEKPIRLEETEEMSKVGPTPPSLTAASSSISMTTPCSISTKGQALIIVAAEGSSVSVGDVVFGTERPIRLEVASERKRRTQVENGERRSGVNPPKRMKPS